MATKFDAVINIGLTLVDDYKLVKLYNQDVDKFNSWVDGFLVAAVPNFIQCRQDLSYDLETREFTSDLSDMEISILADFWAIQWFIRETQVQTEISLGININGGVNRHSEAQNLKEKSAHLDKMREKVRQKITDYQVQELSAYKW